MQARATSASVEPRRPSFAGFSGSSWAFAVRIWLAMLLALYASFWLELEAPSTAAITVAILALPTRGQGIAKAGFRLVATIVGTVASIAIAGLFSQTGTLLLAAFGAWVGLCVYAAGLLDGNRAYAAALCCITVALIAIQQIDSPQLVFPTGIARGAAVAIGVLAIALVNDALAAPDYHPILTNRLEALHQRAMSYMNDTVRDGTASVATAAVLLRDIVAVRPEIASLSTESNSGAARSSAAQAAIVDLVSAVSLNRLFASLPPTLTTDEESGLGLLEVCRSWLEQGLIRTNSEISASLDALRTGTHRPGQWRAPLYRSRRIAVENGISAAISFILIAALLVAAGWPSTELCLSLVAVIIGLSSTAPNPRLFMTIAVLAMPLACLLAGILKYFVFNGVSEFQLLAIGLAPVVIGLALLISLPNGMLSSFGRLTLVFTLAVLAPTNPQSYDPLSFVITCLFATLSSVLVFAAQFLIPALSSNRRLLILLDEIRRELDALDVKRHSHLAPAEALFRDASRVEQIVAVEPTGTAIDEALHSFDRAAAVRQGRAELQPLTTGPLGEAAGIALTALASRNADPILRAAATLREAAIQHHVTADPACAALVLAACAFLQQSGTMPTETRRS